jgi:hypothetical protein
MKGQFKVIVNRELLEFNDYYDIPERIDHVILFKPDYPEGPHTDEEHELIETFNDKLKDLMKREKK